MVVGSISKSRVSWKFQTTPLQIWFTGPVESIFLGKHHFYQPTYAVKWDLKICINLQKYYERSWFHRDFSSKAKFTVRVSCKMSLSLVTVGAKLMYIYHTLDALVMITPFQSITLQRESDFSCTLVEFWKRFDQIWKIPIGTGKWHVFATFQTARLTLESVHSLLGILPSRHSLVLSTPEISTSGVKFPTLFPTYLFRSPLKSF